MPFVDDGKREVRRKESIREESRSQREGRFCIPLLSTSNSYAPARPKCVVSGAFLRIRQTLDRQLFSFSYLGNWERQKMCRRNVCR